MAACSESGVQQHENSVDRNVQSECILCGIVMSSQSAHWGQGWPIHRHHPNMLVIGRRLSCVSSAQFCT